MKAVRDNRHRCAYIPIEIYKTSDQTNCSQKCGLYMSKLESPGNLIEIDSQFYPRSTESNWKGLDTAIYTLSPPGDSEA